MAATDTLTDRSRPDVGPELTFLRTPNPRSGALHEIALQTVRGTDGLAYWVDVGNTASTYALSDLAPDERLLDRIRIARAFTAYQHYALVERVVNSVSPRTGCLVVPNVAASYRHEDVPDYDAEPLFESVVRALAHLAETLDLPVVATGAGPDDGLSATLAGYAHRELECEETTEGYRFEGEDFETDVYWTDSYWQTTLPYWVDLLGAVDDPTQLRTGPAVPFGVGG